jgi:NAD(P)-dependent dehydrogenase (short-subunit alcohol dehydrogenase family)/acyl carrier protein
MSNSSYDNREIVNLLSTYFSRRGNFLAKVIKSDLKNTLFQQYAQTDVSRLLQSNSADQSKLSNSSLVKVPVEVTAVQPLEAGITKDLESHSQTESIQKILINLIVEQTGYPPESINSDAKLLDDLNLDSIKSAEIVAQTAKQISLEGQVDPSLFANATLQEVATALQEFKETGSFTSGDFVHTVEASFPELIAPWVRNYVIEYVLESAESLNEADELTEAKFPGDDWANSSVLIITQVKNKAWADSLSEELQYKGAQVEIVDLQQIKVLIPNNYTHVINILTSVSEANIDPEARLQKAIKQLHTVGSFPAKKTNDYTNVSYIQFGDGYFGKGTKTSLGNIDTHCTIGFAASLHLERTDLKVRVIDLPLEPEPDLLVEEVITEISRPTPYLAIGFDSELKRYIPRPCLQDRSKYKSRNLDWSQKDVVLVTGGAKGITAECTLAWAKNTGVSLALVGSSPHPDDASNGKSSEEIAETLSRAIEANLNCNYYQCDVSDKAALTELITVIEAELGIVTGIIHGAAINRAKPVNKSTPEDAIAEVKPKIMGAINLAEIFQATALKLFVGFSSIGAVTGLPGNTWYSFSNEALDFILRDYKQQHPSTEIISLAYSIWSEVGMGAKMGAVSGLARMGIGAISLQEGVDRFVQLMEQDPGNAQVVIAARIDGNISRQYNFDTWIPSRISPPTSYKFLEQILMNEPGVETVARTHLNFSKDSYVKDHLYRGSYLFPTVFGLEAMAQAVAHTLQIDSFSSLLLENIRLERPIVVHPENGVDIEIQAKVIERVIESEPLKVRVEIRTESTGFTKAHFAADFVLETVIEPTNYEISQPLATLDIEPKKDLYGWLLFQGEKFQRIEEIYSLDSQKMIFLTEQQNFAEANSQDRSDGPFLLGDPYCRDSLLHSVQPMVPEDLCLPLGIQRMEIHLAPENLENYYIGIALREQTANEQHNTTVMAVNRSGRVIEKLSGYQLKIMEHLADNPTAEELVDPQIRDYKLLYQELNERAQIFGIVPPEVSIAHLPGLHNLPVEERHRLELPLFYETLDKLMQKLE